MKFKNLIRNAFIFIAMCVSLEGCSGAFSADWLSISLSSKSSEGKTFVIDIGSERLERHGTQEGVSTDDAAFNAIKEEFVRRDICLRGFQFVERLADAEGGIVGYRVFCPGIR